MTRTLPLWGFILTAVLLCVPILAHPHLPMVDLPNHIARLHIAANPESVLNEYYSYILEFRTNVAVDVLWLSIGSWFLSAEEFSNIMFAVYAVGFLGSIMVLSRLVHGQWLMWPLVSNLVVFNAVYFWGFENYLITAAAALYMLALWLWMENQPNYVRILVFIPLCMLLYAMHILGLLILMATAFGREVQVVIEAKGNWRQILRRNWVLSVPFLFPIGIVVYGILCKPPNIYGGAMRFGDLRTRLEVFTAPVSSVISDWSQAMNLIGFTILYVILGLLLTSRRKEGARLHFNPRLRGPVIALCVLSLFLPDLLNGVAVVHLRFSFVLLGVIFAATTWVDLKPKHGAMLFAVMAVLSITRAVSVERTTSLHSQEITQLISVLDAVPPGSRVLPLRNMKLNPSPRLWHMQAYAVAEAESFIPTLFIGTHNLHLHEEWWDSAKAIERSTPGFLLLDPPRISKSRSSLRNWTYLYDWEQKFTHVLTLNTMEEDYFDEMPVHLLKSEGIFSVYEIEHES